MCNEIILLDYICTHRATTDVNWKATDALENYLNGFRPILPELDSFYMKREDVILFVERVKMQCYYTERVVGAASLLFVVTGSVSFSGTRSYPPFPVPPSPDESNPAFAANRL